MSFTSKTNHKSLPLIETTNITPGITRNSAYFASLEDQNYYHRLISTYIDEDFFKKPKELIVKEFEEKLKNWKYITRKNDEFRPSWANKNGGIDYPNEDATKINRSIGGEIIKQVGKKILSGDFKLTTISMHIKIMKPLTILQQIGQSLLSFPLYMKIANEMNDPLERFKLVVVATIASFFRSSGFVKPLNPVLGETWEVSFEDGSDAWLEQTCHHPPVSSFYLLGPYSSFKYYGFCSFQTSATFNGVKVFNKGKRWVEFKDKTKISFNCFDELFNNTFVGVHRHETFGEAFFKDETHGFELKVKMGSVSKKPNDYFQGDIKVGNIIVSKVLGSYVSHLDFDGIRYWDIRDNFDLKNYQKLNQLKSSSFYREDAKLLSQGLIDEAQEAKEIIENNQRKDRQLRKNWKSQTNS